MATIAAVLRRPTSPTGVWAWITTVDHKRIGVLYLVTAFTFFLIGGLEAMAMRTQLMRADNSVVSASVFSQLFTMHALTMIFLGVMPLSAAFFNFIVPLQIGARDVAFPRLNALSYWVFLFGGILLNLGWFTGGAADAGWFAYANLTERTYTPSHGMDFYVLGLLVLGVSSLAAALNFIITIINLRAPGMTLMRMPVFIWMTLVTSFLLVFAFPVITVGLFQLLFDRFFGTNFFNVAGGGDVIMWQHLFWVFGHPEVYILILPAMGIVSEVLPAFSRKPLFGYPFVVFSGVVIGFMGWGVWAHHMFTTGMGPVADAVFSVTTMLIAVPTGVKIFNWLGTLWGGSLDLKTPMLFALGFVFLFIIGGLSGVSHASPPADLQQQDTYYIVAHIHYVLFGGSIFGIFAGLYYWFPKMTNRLLNEGVGKLNFWLMFIGMNMAFAPMHWYGLQGMPRRIYTYPSGMGWDGWNLVSTIGGYILAVGILVFVYNVFSSLRRGRVAGDDPWDGRTLEWAIPSPPPHYNFAEIPVVHGRDAFWEQKYGAGHGEGAQTPMHRPVAGGSYEAHADIHMPSPSYWPIVVSFGLLLLALGVVYGLAPVMLLGLPFNVTSLLGVGIIFIGIYGWSIEPVA